MASNQTIANLLSAAAETKVQAERQETLDAVARQVQQAVANLRGEQRCHWINPVNSFPCPSGKANSFRLFTDGQTYCPRHHNLLVKKQQEYQKFAPAPSPKLAPSPRPTTMFVPSFPPSPPRNWNQIFKEQDRLGTNPLLSVERKVSSPVRRSPRPSIPPQKLVQEEVAELPQDIQSAEYFTDGEPENPELDQYETDGMAEEKEYVPSEPEPESEVEPESEPEVPAAKRRKTPPLDDEKKAQIVMTDEQIDTLLAKARRQAAEDVWEIVLLKMADMGMLQAKDSDSKRETVAAPKRGILSFLSK